MSMREIGGVARSCRPERELVGRDWSIGLTSNIDYTSASVLFIKSRGLL